MYKANLTPKPYASPAQCVIDQPDTLENIAKKEKKNFKKLSKREKKIENICEILNLSETELLNCKHSTHITRTCRAVTKSLYPDIDTQAEKCLKSLPREQIRAIIEYAKLVHPCERQTSISKLKNTIGNTEYFQSEAKKWKVYMAAASIKNTVEQIEPMEMITEEENMSLPISRRSPNGPAGALPAPLYLSEFPEIFDEWLPEPSRSISYT
ncbi:unnamed protein product [Rotaria sordida]|uniref:Uncharacterized protein n=1 Tax=Rotaria sordida TaxID=392033 RepID=A0A814U5F6_9BILA|nr:unnamed protein product [Rotaria sordida]CAF1423454.1 unnamed protein product [Rotaria sordida]